MCEHLGVFALTGKRMKSYHDSAITDLHHLFCNHSSDSWQFYYTNQRQQLLQSYFNEEYFNQQKPPSFE